VAGEGERERLFIRLIADWMLPMHQQPQRSGSNAAADLGRSRVEACFNSRAGEAGGKLGGFLNCREMGSRISDSYMQISIRIRKPAHIMRFVWPDFSWYLHRKNDSRVDGVFPHVFSLPDRQRERERETERQRDRETERQRDRETERQRDRETEEQCNESMDHEGIVMWGWLVEEVGWMG